MYVDDLMKSVKTTEEALKLVSELKDLLARGGFHLRKWCSNDRDVVLQIPEEERAKSLLSLDLDNLPTESTLGLKWNTETDKFVWQVLEKMHKTAENAPMTRRGVLSVVYSLFDPLGFLAPFLMKAKLLLQMFSRKRLRWDEQLGETDREQWLRWLKDLPQLSRLRVDRCYKPKSLSILSSVELHLFSDGSRVGYSSVAYLRFVGSDTRIHCAFVIGKSRLAPIKEISIPRVELAGAVLSVRLCRLILEELELPIREVTYWTDSMSVLKCINNTSKRFHTFESNRLALIHLGSKPHQWRYVNRDDNPADDGSKGLKLNSMINKNRWVNGHDFLWKEEGLWPKKIETPELADDDIEVRKEARIYATGTSDKEPDMLMKFIHHYSS
ncbi:hypothetical protein SNE40_019844 [Patella caerulea]|uniref:Uncharacterized protein n=1 Tax=Patella caerulea TaxID=87958 RepID=A0AAN8G2P9_PATCE